MISIRKPQSNYNQEGNQSIRQGGGIQGAESARRGCRNALRGRSITAFPLMKFFNFDLSAEN